MDKTIDEQLQGTTLVLDSNTSHNRKLYIECYVC